MKVQTQLLVVVVLTALVVAVAALESERLEREPEIVRRAYEQAEAGGRTVTRDAPDDEDALEQTGEPGLAELFRQKSDSRALRSEESEEDLLKRLEGVTLSNLDSLLANGVPHLILKQVLDRVAK